MSIFNSKKDKYSGGAPCDKNSLPRIADIPVTMISPNPDQPRKNFDEESIDELGGSISKVGLIQPLIVRQTDIGYELIAGERRLRAVKKLGWDRVRCIIDPRPSGESAVMAVVENLQREDLDYFEEAECFASLIRKFGMTQEELAVLLGKSQSFIANKLRLLKLDPDTARAVSEAGLSERHARALLALKDASLRLEAVRRIAGSGLSVKEAEKLVDKMNSASSEQTNKHGPRIIRIFRDYRIFINTVNSACDQLRECGLNVTVVQTDLDNGVDITIRVTQ